MDKAINHFCESLICWSYDNGIFYISGRDIACMIVGFLVCLILVMIGVSYANRNKR